MKAFILITSLLISATSIAHKGAMGVVKERMDAMVQMGDSNKILTAMVRRKTEFNSDIFLQELNKIAQADGKQLINLFPDSSLMSPTEARETIWQNWQEFTQLANDLENSVDALTTHIENDNALTANVIKEYKAMATTCKQCHKKFREKK